MAIKNKIVLSLIIVFLLGFSLLVFLVYPTYIDIKDSPQELTEQEKKLAFLEEKIRNIEEFKKNYQEIKQNVEKAKILFANPEAPVNFIGFLEETAQDSNIFIEISPSIPKVEGEDPWNSIRFKIAVAGSFPSFLKFLEKIESSPYLVKIDNLNIMRLAEREILSKKFQRFSVGDIRGDVFLKVYASSP
ncbi:MAG: type 4a pilus biogenesis protein PilO [Patescibacteria group bacterium]|nr:type 4a pilus biogenesis protein PilO [Patescibacteria group bacterium]